MNGIDLAPEQEAALLQAARRVRDSERDEFFKDVSDILRPVREVAQTDIHRAVCIAMAKQRRFKRLNGDGDLAEL